MTPEPAVQYSTDGSVTRIRLNRPDRLNAVSRQMVHELCAALERAIDEGSAAIILSGQGRAFCAGQDLKEVDPPGSSVEDRTALLERAQDITRLVQAAPCPVIAAVHGYALGAGCEFALMSDLIVASEDAQFGFPEVAVAQSVTQGISWRLPRAIGPARAKELVLLGERFSAHDALAMGLINRVVPAGEQEEAADAWARELASRPPLSLKLAKRALDAGVDGALHDALAREVTDAMRVHDDPAMRTAAEAFARRT